MIDAVPEYSLASLGKIKQLINLKDQTDTQFDVMLTTMAITATQMIETALGVSLLRKQYVEYLNTSRNHTSELDLRGSGMIGAADREGWKPVRILLKAYPIDTEEDVEVRYDPDRVWDANSIIPAVDYQVEPEGGRIILDYPVCTGTRTLKLTYTAGFAVDYEPVAEASDREDELLDSADLTTNMNAVDENADEAAILYDAAQDKEAANAVSLAADDAYVQILFDSTRVIQKARWCAPNDKTVHANTGVNMDTTTLILQGSVLGDFTDTAEIARREYTGVTVGQEVEVSAGTHSTAYKGFRVVAQGAAGATHTYCAQVRFLWKDHERGFLVGASTRLITAAAMLAKYLWQKNRSGSVGLTTAPDRRQASFASNSIIPGEVAELLSPYRRLRIG